MPRLTELERALLAALRENGREPVSSLAKTLNVSRVTVSKLMQKLEGNGVIVGYTARINEHANQEQVHAISLIEVERTSTRTAINQLRGIPEITNMHTTNGAWDLVIELSCDSLSSFDRVLRQLRSVEGVVNSETSLLLSSVLR